MSNRKNYNSIVFLTTLSVYLGLVLVGGAVAPSVLAQAALTRNFDIKNEIVIEDDLDKKPDNDELINFAKSLDSYFEEAGNFVEDLQKLRKLGKFDLTSDKFEIESQLNIACNVNGDPVAHSTLLSKNFGNRPFESAITDAGSVFSGWEYLSDCLKDEKAENAFSTSSKLKLFYDNTELKIEISAPKLIKQRADFLAERFNQTYDTYKVDEDQIIVKTIHKNTSFKSENNQVFIVTRLPRGSIDALLAQKDAQ